MDKKRILQEYRLRTQEIAVGLSRQESLSPKIHLEQEKKMRREIANSNERRRMQSINAGFQSLKTVLPHQDGEKLSKAAILQQTTDFISSLLEEKQKLLAQNTHLKCVVEELTRERDNEGLSIQDSPLPKRKKRDTESSDEGISMSIPSDYGDDTTTDDFRRELIDLRCQLDRERRHRTFLDEKIRTLEAKIYPEKIRALEGKMYPDHLRQLQRQMQARMQLHSEKTMYPEATPPLCQSTEQRVPVEDGFKNSMSRKNLETMFEAICHLEGGVLDEMQFEDKRTRIAHSEESDKESVTSDREDDKSDSSGRNSPEIAHCAPHPNVQYHHASTYTEKYPIAVQLLHIPPQYYHRPGVIVHKS